MQASQWLGLDERHLTAVDDRHFLHPETKQAWLSMVQAAADDGLQLDLVSSYRSFARQQLIWDGKFSGQRPVLDDQNRIIELNKLSDWQKIQAIMRFSALPGTSRHHWGSDLDLFSKPLQGNTPLQLVASEYQAGGPQWPLYQWLIANAHRFDFFFPYAKDLGGVACEPWHLSHLPVANKVEQVRKPERIIAAIQQANVLGQECIQENFDTLYHRFISPISR
ncbi:M15 family metallopeptidase [Neiella marina]|uniref:M15 family metallopeptidase n=1 Tax=Neiella holothuriorum TaxID=2870530 RepID=A0ABS7EIN5_9GAMM|nr:M15 family metallopeptidase [Neiella holothuriorum]MBW8192190.1 M15 family metallopeptidase [Neiella holothuriorum]